MSASFRAAFATCLILLSSSGAWAQVDTAWIRHYDGPALSNDLAYGLAVDVSGYAYQTGESPGSGTERDFATVKWSPNGDTVWTARYTFPAVAAHDRGNAVTVDAAGNVYVTGQSVSPGQSFDYLTIKYRPTGDTAWVRRYAGAGSSTDIPRAIAVDPGGNVYITGSSEGDYVTVKYDSTGTQKWAVHYNGPAASVDDAQLLAMDASGNILVTGNSEGATSSTDYATIKYDSAGNVLWARRYNGPGNSSDYGKSLFVDPAGSVYVTGHSIGSGTSNDFATIKYTPAGDTVWVRRFHNGNDVGLDVAVDAAGNVYVTGSTVGPFGGFEDFATIKYNASGDSQWVALHNGPAAQADVPMSVVVGPEGDVYVTGKSYAGFTTGANDIAILRYGANGMLRWAARYNGAGNGNDEPTGMVVDGAGNVYVSGGSTLPGNVWDYVLLKYAQSPHIDASPRPVVFGFVPEGDSAEVTVQVSNTGARSMVLGAVGGPSSPFSMISESCSGATLEPFGLSAPCEVALKFHPTGPGPFTDTLYIPSNDPDRPVLPIPLSGVGGGDTILIYSVTPSQVVTGVPVVLEIAGQQFAPDLSAFLREHTPGPGRDTIAADSVAVPDSFHVTAYFTLKETDLDYYDVLVTRPGGESAKLPDAVYLLVSLVLPEVRSVGFNGFSIGVERYGKLLCENVGTADGFMLFELSRPAPPAIDLRLLNEDGDTLFSSYADSSDSVVYWLVPGRYGEAYWLSDGWKVDPAKVIYPRVIPGAADDDEFVLFGQGKQVSVKGVTGLLKDQVKDMVKNVIIGTACQSLADYLVGKDVNVLENAINSAVEQLEAAQEAVTPAELMKAVANQLNPLSGWLGIVETINGCMKTIVGQFINNWEQRRAEKAASICQLSGAQRADQLGRVLNERSALSVLAAQDALLNCQSKGSRSYTGNVRGSWDPNEKTADGNYVFATLAGEDTVRPVYSIAVGAETDSIGYTILFENKAAATDSAVNVFITDTLDVNLDLSTLRIDSLAARGSFSWALNGQVLTFQFLNIMLAPNVNPPEGEWYAGYWVAPRPGLAPGTALRNRASIVFDFNPAIQTGEVVHMICPIAVPGDVNSTGNVTSADIISAVNYVFKSGAEPQPCAGAADANCNGAVTSADIIQVVNYVFKGGAVPCNVCGLIHAGVWSCP